MAARWYAICSKPNKEEVLLSQLQASGFEVFYPCFITKASQPNAPKEKTDLHRKPYFPGYLFVRTDIEAVGISIFQWMPFGGGLVCLGGKPVHVPDALIQAIQKRIHKMNTSPGDSPGPLSQTEVQPGHPAEAAGYQAVFENGLSGRERVEMLLKILDEMKVSAEESGS